MQQNRWSKAHNNKKGRWKGRPQWKCEQFKHVDDKHNTLIGLVEAHVNMTATAVSRQSDNVLR